MRVAEDLTVLVLTYDEIANIERTLNSVAWAPRILVIDSGSTDGTLAIIANFKQARVEHRPFDNFANQCNFGLSRIQSEWVLSIDADYELSRTLIDELQGLRATPDTDAYSAKFAYIVNGRALRSTLYPPRYILYRKALAKYKNVGHGHRVIIDGPVSTLGGLVHHNDEKPLSRWFNSQQNYAKREAQHLLNSSLSTLKITDRIRLLAWPAPILVFIYILLVKLCIFDGWRGWHYTMQRTIAELMIALEIIDHRLRQNTSRSDEHRNSS
ncbi:MAG: glycosyl transferase [Hyphomicrobium sp.]|nr:MAG: glycosyl transferase [Hyphomicrobium sp.]PPD01600.1 MAG: glycosyl transferase [Hyphomicrobium sp.]